MQVLLKEVVLGDADIPKAILEYIGKNLLNNIVVGASTRNAFARYLFVLSLCFLISIKSCIMKSFLLCWFL